MKFGETLKRLRKQKDMTQEQLAEYLNISAQAVSRWETSLTLPDITVLPAIANIFDVSADVLLGIDIDAKEKRVQAILDKANEFSCKGYRNKSAEILRAGLKEFPNSYKIMRDLLHSIWALSQHSDKVYETPEEREKEVSELRCEVIKLGEKILAESTEDDCRHSAVQLLCYTYPVAGDPEKAEKLAEKMPTACLSRESLLRSIYTGDKKYRIYQDCIMSGLDNLFHDMQHNMTLDDGSKPYTTEELIIIYKKALAITEIMIEDGNYGLMNQRFAWAYIDIARFYAKLEDYANALETLKLAAGYSIRDCEYIPGKEYTSLLFRGKKFGEVYHNITENDSMYQLNEMKDSAFDPLRGHAEFIEIEERLKKYAAKREI